MTLFAWGLALMPLVAFPFLWVVNPLWFLLPLVLIGVGDWWLTRQDGRHLAASGRERVPHPRLFGPTVYLIRRTLRAGSTPLLPIVHGALIITAIVLIASVSRPAWAFSGGDTFVFSTDDDARIAQELSDRLGEPVDVTCEDGVVTKGDIILCTTRIVRTDHFGKVRVTIGSGGSYYYQVLR